MKNTKDNQNQEISIYIHYPFCKSKCPYCDFNSHVYLKIDHNRFLEAYLREIEFFAQRIKNTKIKTIFFGGGTPSLMPIKLAEKIIDKIANTWTISDHCEITIEANPTSFEARKFEDFRKIGINRLSIGIQALNDKDLKFLGREHNSSEAIKTIETAQKIFDNCSFDLIYMRPNQNLSDWENELKRAISFGSNHLSLYGLTIEKGTEFYGQYKNGQFTLPDVDLAAEFYELTNQITKNSGLELYEISNYARDNYECKHNLAYWNNEDYLGIGAGAHSRISLNQKQGRIAINMVCEPEAWLKKVEIDGAGIQKTKQIKKLELLEEILIMGLRLKNGIKNDNFKKYFGKNISEIFNFEKLTILRNKNLIEINNDFVLITESGRLITDSIIKKLLDNIYDQEL